MLDKWLTLKIGDFGFARAGDQVPPHLSFRTHRLLCFADGSTIPKKKSGQRQHGPPAHDMAWPAGACAAAWANARRGRVWGLGREGKGSAPASVGWSGAGASSRCPRRSRGRASAGSGSRGSDSD